MTKVVLNENHNLLKEQIDILNKKFPNGWELLSVPSKGWTKNEQMELAEKLNSDTKTLVFASPVPVLLAKTTAEAVVNFYAGHIGVEPGTIEEVLVFHNDKRKKNERNGSIFYTVEKTGWELISC